MSIFVKTVVTILITTISAGTVVESQPNTVAPVVSRQVAEPTPAPAEGIIAPNATAAQLQVLEAAIETFEAAGLELPAIEVRFHEDTAPCKGHGGLYRASEDPSQRDTITMCNDKKLLLFHELAHAWERRALDDHHRDHLTEAWDLPTWRDHDFDWKERATERAAHTIAFTLTRSEPTDNENINRYGCDYEKLTGVALPKPEFFSCG